MLIELVLVFNKNVIGLTGNDTFFYAFLVFPELILLLYNCKGLNKICSNVVFNYLGNISFGIYLWNFPILITIHILLVKGVSINVASYIFIIMLILIHIIVGSISYTLIDKKLCGFLNKFYSKRILEG